MSVNREQFDWWTSLKHGGLLIAPGKLGQYFPVESEPLGRRHTEQLRRDLTRFVPGDSQSLAYLLDTVLEDVLGLERRLWFKSLGPEWSQKAITGETIRPRRVWVDAHEHAFPVFVDKDITRIGIGRGRRTASRVVEWLRKADHKLALLTNGRQWRLIHAGADYDAWAESDTDQWFAEGQPSAQVDALRLLLNPDTLGTNSATDSPVLWTAIQASRQGQAELSGELGERVRRAVELLISESAVSIKNVQQSVTFGNNDLYIAANRIIMRCVIILFAEARDLLPRDNIIYHTSYGLQGLREQLDRRAGGHALERLRHSYSAWPRLLALFRLMYDGSLHEALPIPTYGGQLFAPADENARDPISRALVAFEQVDPCPSDASVYRILELLTKSKIKVRQGNQNTWVDAPVDFSDLSTEYIGILYQGLLDFELRQAEADEPMIFLDLGDQPVLPLSRLESMDDVALSALVEKLKKASKPAASDDVEEDDEEDAVELDVDDEQADAETEDDVSEGETDEEEDDVDTVRQLRERAKAWAVQAVKAGGLVSKPRSRSSEALAAYEAEVAKFAPRLIARIVRPGEWFLVRWGGTRKGSGTFYTRPQLGVPLVRRTLQPLAYQQEGDAWIPRLPEEILDLKVCDSAMGSASLLVAALRYLTGALFESLFYHGRISAHGEQGVCRLADGQLTDELIKESLPVPPDHEEFEGRLQARLKRYVVERCIYGVDLNPLAVELARLSLWIETMDPRLPFSFVDHKLKVGNALVGCWLDRFQDYPVMAWEREGGDINHDLFVHHHREFTMTRGKNKGKKEQRGDKWTQAIKDMRNGSIKPEMTVWIQQLSTRIMNFGDKQNSATDLHASALRAFEKMHHLAIADPRQQEAIYYEQIAENPAYKQLKLAFDSWCAIWFWPGDLLDHVPTPLDFQSVPKETMRIVRQLATELKFFHWELEFPDVFGPHRTGFDAVVQNPPWETLEPNSLEFFSNHDPLYRTYGRQNARRHQESYFNTDSSIEREWIIYNSRNKSLTNFLKHNAFPFGDNDSGKFSFTRSKIQNRRLHTMWISSRNMRRGFADLNHPYLFQGGGKAYTYKLFLELGHYLLGDNGMLGAIVPTGLYTDKGSIQIRKLFLENCRWQWLFSMINWNRIFEAIYYRFKFCLIIIQKGSETDNIKAAFLRYHLHEWEQADRYVIPYSKEQVTRFSPISHSLLEVRTHSDLTVLDKIYADAELLGTAGNSWDVKYQQGDLNMASDFKLLKSRSRVEVDGFIPTKSGLWLKGEWRGLDSNQLIQDLPLGTIPSADGTLCISKDAVESMYVPLLEGRMISGFDFSARGWVSGKGRGSIWREIPYEFKVTEPQYLCDIGDLKTLSKSIHIPRLHYMRIASATNTRTIYCAYTNFCVAEANAPFLMPGRNGQVLSLVSIFNSFSFDWQMRNRIGGLTADWHILEQAAILPARDADPILSSLALRLNGISERFSALWLEEIPLASRKANWFSLWAVTKSERLRLRCILDAIVAGLFGFEQSEFGWMLNGVDYPAETMRKRDFYRTLDPKGFWRVDKDKDPELRHTVLSLIAFHDLKQKGLDAFLAQNDGEGWLLPETLRLADYGLGHDDRAKEHQPVASRLGSRFLPWQLKGTPERSWAECERHAENLRLLLGDLVEEPKQEQPTMTGSNPDYSPVADLTGEPLQRDLFGNIVYPKKRKR